MRPKFTKSCTIVLLIRTLAVIPWIEAGLPGTISRISPGAAPGAAALDEEEAAEADDAELTLGTMALRIMPSG